jgi:ATP-dependent helicase YprA (DUF1998 family)
MNRDDPLPEIHALSLVELTARLRISIPSQLRPDEDFLDALSDADQVIAIKACLLAWEMSRNFGTQICPRPWQIEAVLASINNTNSIINVGTGQGKNLCAILPQLLFPNSVTIVISPLKRLMASQVKECHNWGIRAVAINEDTSKQKGFWDVRCNWFHFHTDTDLETNRGFVLSSTMS